MLKSINQPWAISEKYVNRYGTTWTNLDFVFEDKNICYRYDNSGMKRKWVYDKENPAN